MDRYVSQSGMDFQLGVVNVDLVFTSDGTDTTVTPTIGDGIASLTCSSTTYTVTFQDAYVGTLNFGPSSVVQASWAAAGAKDAVPLTIAQTSGNPLSMTFQFLSADTGAAVHPASGDVCRVTFRLQRQETT